MKKVEAKILVVDDDERALRLMEAMLAPKGYEVILSKNGEEALDIARLQNPDVILLDIFMPGMDGYTALTKLKEDEMTANIPVIMVSAVGYNINKKIASMFGAVEYVTKPVELVEVLGAIDHFLHTSK